MVLNTFYGYWLSAFAGALDDISAQAMASERRAAAIAAAKAGLDRAAEAATAGTLSTDEFTRVQDAILRAIDDDTDEEAAS